jgi:hypothetical protein
MTKPRHWRENTVTQNTYKMTQFMEAQNRQNQVASCFTDVYFDLQKARDN